ncbi:MAG: Uma2 family endonuclease [Pseudomonadota bacterium]
MNRIVRKHPSAPATYADIEALPENMVGEIVFGVLNAHPRPAPPHAFAAFELSGELRGPFRKGVDGPGGWTFLIESELHLADHVIVPDIAGWRSVRLSGLSEKHYIETPSDWLCEILSPSTARIDRTDKLQIYASFGVPHCWYVDPLAKTLEVLELQKEKYTIAATFKAGDDVTAPPFEAHTFPLNVLWPLDPADEEQPETP